MKKKIFILLSTVILLSLIITVLMFSNPLRRPITMIESRLLKLTPLGSTMEEVVIAIEKEGWRFGYVTGYTNNQKELVSRFGEIFKFNENDKKIIYIYMGEYRVVMPCIVVAYFNFDEDGFLVNIKVLKEWDSI
ncbi:MAG: hypothetical protein LBB56_01275 [Chitinispirillales bacterium]|jgi:hypothetical protein|nr:hypothetical protein [Chitinispirillales bacterium]